MTSKIAPELIDNLEDGDSINTSNAIGTNIDDALNNIVADLDELKGTINAIGSIGGGIQDIDLDLGKMVTATVDTSATTFTFSNPLATDNEDGFVFDITDGGSQTVTWAETVQWVAGAEPALTTTGKDRLVFTTLDGGTTWQGFVVGLDIKVP